MTGPIVAALQHIENDTDKSTFAEPIKHPITGTLYEKLNYGGSAKNTRTHASRGVKKAEEDEDKGSMEEEDVEDQQAVRW